MKYILSSLLIFTLSIASAQDIDWQKTSNWKFYKISGDEGLRYSADTLGKIPFVEINQDSIEYFIKQVALLPIENKPIWMGAYYASCVIDAKLHKIDISVYAGFFYDELTKRYYQLPKDLRNEWKAWLITLKKRANEKQ